MNEQNKGSNDKIIDDFVQSNGLQLMDLELYLFARGIVCITEEEHYEED